MLFIHMKLCVCEGRGFEVHTHQLCNVCERTPYWKCRIQGNIIHYSVVVSVLLTSCVKAISPPTHSFPPSLRGFRLTVLSKWKNPKPKVTEAFGRPCQLLWLHECPSDVQTVCCAASTLQHYWSNSHLGDMQ